MQIKIKMLLVILRLIGVFCFRVYLSRLNDIVRSAFSNLKNWHDFVELMKLSCMH